MSWQAKTTSFVLRHWFKPRLARTPDAVAASKVMGGGPTMPAPPGAQATAGTVGRKAIFALPGSEKAVRLAMTRLVIPELGHIIQQLSK